ncbi:MAG TPA: glycosyltransferase family 39 protein [Blastocatellia bacterium]|nr:glycosyltransferase family 39 protein [Blastocatellia bacterium]
MAGLTLFFGLGRLALVGPDEPRYAEVPREMVATGDYVSPRLGGCLWFEKPVLQYWLSAAAYKVFGVSEFAARAPSALAALLTAAALFFALRRVVSLSLALAASIVLLTMGIFIAFARVVSPDMPLAASMSVAIICGFLATTAEREKAFKYWSLCGALLGLAVLAKGLVGVVLVAGILGIYLLFTRNLRAIDWRAVLVAIVILLVVAAIWYVPVTIRHGWAFVEKFFLEHHFERYLTNRHSHPQPAYFYLFVTIAGAMPWSFFLIPAVVRLRKLKPRTDRRDSLLALAWIWLALPLLFFSFSVSKLPGYLLPVFPALAIIIGVEVDQFLSRAGRLHSIVAWLTCLLLAALGIAFVIYTGRLSIDSGALGKAIVWLPVAAALAAAASLVAGKRSAFTASASAVVASVIAGAVFLVFPILNETQSLRTLSEQAAAALKPGERIAFFLMKEFAPVFYAEGRVVCGVGNGTVLNAIHTDKLVEVLETESSIIIFTTSNWVADLESDPRLLTEPVAAQGDARAIRVTLRE